MKHITTLIRRYFLRIATDIPALEIVVYDDAVMPLKKTIPLRYFQ